MTDSESASRPDDRPHGELQEELLLIVNQEMPFGRFKGRKLIELPEPYLVWFKNQGFPSGKLGQRLAVMYEIKVNGIEKLLQPLRDTTLADYGDGSDD